MIQLHIFASATRGFAQKRGSGQEGHWKMNGCKTEESMSTGSIGFVFQKMMPCYTMLIALSVDGFDKVLREHEGWSRREVGPLPFALRQGWYFMRRRASSCGIPSETASAIVVTTAMSPCTEL